MGSNFYCVKPCEHSRINILQWMLTKLGIYLDLKRIWNPIDFQGQRSRSQGLIFRQGDMPRFALPFFLFLSSIVLKVTALRVGFTSPPPPSFMRGFMLLNFCFLCIVLWTIVFILFFIFWPLYYIEILLKLALNTIILTPVLSVFLRFMASDYPFL